MEREIEDIGARETEKGIEGKIFKRKRERFDINHFVNIFVNITH